MNEMVTLREEQSEKVIKTVINEKTPAIMSYSSRGKWHVAKVLLVDSAAGRLRIESLRSDQKQHPINVMIDQPVGISFKHNFGKFVFDTTVVSLEPSSNQQAKGDLGGTIVLNAPEIIKVVERRSYYRVEVPESLKVKVLMWHRSAKHDSLDKMHSKHDLTCECCQGRLMDISAGGAQIIASFKNEPACTNQSENQTETNSDVTSNVESMNFKKGQFIGLRFTPMPYETPLILSAQIRSVLPTEDGQGLSIGLQIVGLEASPEGHAVLSRLISVVGKYYQINQTGVKQTERDKVPSLV
ncbi:MAG: PilZ domain-containing protein [Sedimentisphaerales bacterium]|nr:PilZ domain-containing protein [Sedimentisphaerales bacterium]